MNDTLWIGLCATLLVALGVALKDLGASVLARIVIVLDRSCRVGDRVSCGGFHGEIRDIGLRAVRLVTQDDEVVTIPNVKFLSEITSSNRGAPDVPVQMEFFIAANEDVAAAKRIVEEAVQSSRFASTAKPWMVHVAQVLVGPYVAIRLRVKVHVVEAKYAHALESDVTERVLEGFAQRGIAIPSVALREDRVGGTPGASPQRR